MYQARCQCKNLTADIKEEAVIQLCCHCVDCQDAVSADYASIAFFKKTDVEISGDVREKRYLAEVGTTTVREYCVECGTVMFDRSEGFPTLIGVMTSQISEPFITKYACHVWVKDKNPGVELPNDIPCHHKGIPRK